MMRSDKQAVREVVEQYIQGTYTGDGKKLRNCFHSKAMMSGYFNDRLLIGTPEPFFKDIEDNQAMADAGLPYHGEIVSLDITQKVANVTLKETGFPGGMAFTDYFNLLKEDDEWKIISKTFTSE